MEYNSSNEIVSNQNIIEDSPNIENNSFQKELSEISKNFPLVPSIGILEQSLSLSNSIINILLNEINDKRVPYLNKDEIQEIKIKDKDILASGEKIETYIKSFSSNDDEKFNKCKNCKNFFNKFFCIRCRKNICEKCSKFCQDKTHYLINLNSKEKEINSYKNYIKSIISKYFIQIPNKDIHNEEKMEKKQKTYTNFDENEINDKIGDNIKNYSNDILLIEAIIEKNYNNYFHFKNIEECYSYMKEKYEDINNHDLIENEEREKNDIELNSEEALNESKESIKFKETITKEISDGISKIITKFNSEENNWFELIKAPENQEKIIHLKKNLEILFEKIFKEENINKKINKKFISSIKAFNNFKNLEKMNFVIMGVSGVGKSTLINELFGEKLAKEGMGTRTTHLNKKYESKIWPFFTLLDTVGPEIGSGYNLNDILEETLKYLYQRLDSDDPNEAIHCLIYCIQYNRLLKDELKIILKLREKYGAKRLPIVIVQTRSIIESETEKLKIEVNQFLNENGQSLSNDNEGINFININAREEKLENFGKVSKIPCFGLPLLMSNCFKKGENAYRISIKNSIIQALKNELLQNIDKIEYKFSKNPDYFYYLNQELEPNLPDYIAYYFEKITDLDNLDKSQYIEDITLKNYLNDKEKKNGNKEEITENSCMFCQKPTKGNFHCSFCKSFSCENCFLSHLNEEGETLCINCSQKIERNSIDAEKEKNKKISNKGHFMHILKNNLNKESIKLIQNYVKETKDELIDIIIVKMNEFTIRETEKLYLNLLEKYIDDIIEYKIKNFKEIEKKQEIKKEILKKVNIIFKDKAIGNFMKKVSGHLSQYIHEIFKNKLKNKINEFTKNIDKIKEINNYFQSLDIINEKKELKIKEKIDKYISELINKEADSTHKILKDTYGYYS